MGHQSIWRREFTGIRLLFNFLFHAFTLLLSLLDGEFHARLEISMSVFEH